MRVTSKDAHFSVNQKDFKETATTPSTQITHLQEKYQRDIQAQISQFTREQQYHSSPSRQSRRQRQVLKEYANQIFHGRQQAQTTIRSIQEIDHKFEQIRIRNNTGYIMDTPYGFDSRKDRIMLGDRSLHYLLTCNKLQFGKMMVRVSQTGYFHRQKGIRVTCKMYGIRKSSIP